MVKTLCFHCRWHGFDPWSGNQDPTCHVAQLVWKTVQLFLKKLNIEGFPGGTVVKNLPAYAGDMSSSPGPGRSHMPQSN